jgi:hypothetical protein
MAERLSPIRCGRCAKIVGHMNKNIPGAESGGMCKSCEKAFTFYGVVAAPCQRPCCQEASA